MCSQGELCHVPLTTPVPQPRGWPLRRPFLRAGGTDTAVRGRGSPTRLLLTDSAPWPWPPFSSLRCDHSPAPPCSPGKCLIRVYLIQILRVCLARALARDPPYAQKPGTGSPQGAPGASFGDRRCGRSLLCARLPITSHTGAFTQALPGGAGHLAASWISLHGPPSVLSFPICKMEMSIVVFQG